MARGVAAPLWASTAAGQANWATAGDGIRAAVTLISSQTGHNLNSTDIEHRLGEFDGLNGEAAAIALNAMEPAEAVSLSEQARGFICPAARATHRPDVGTHRRARTGPTVSMVSAHNSRAWIHSEICCTPCSTHRSQVRPRICQMDVISGRRSATSPGRAPSATGGQLPDACRPKLSRSGGHRANVRSITCRTGTQRLCVHPKMTEGGRCDPADCRTLL